MFWSQEINDAEDDGFELTAECHIPVMLKEVLEYLQPREGGVFVDGTLGLGGHAEAVCAGIGITGRLIGIDQDIDALRLAQDRLQRFAVNKDFVHDNFRNIDQVLGVLGVSQVDGILLDLGVSSFQLDEPQRGFNLRHDGPLDMRMDPEAAISAYDLVNGLSEREIEEILRCYGEERFSRRIARVLIQQRMQAPIATTHDLKRVVMRAMPRGRRYQKIHPATRTFQAFRIAVNRELEALEIVLANCVTVLRPGGRIAVIAFHSLEDRIVKTQFRAQERCGALKILAKKPLRPTDEEIIQNPRARSARLRVGEKI